MEGSLFETLKFVVRISVLIFVPLFAEQIAGLEGTVIGELLAVTLPVLDKWVHETDSVKANGLLPF